MKDLNPYAVVMLWSLSILMAAAIALGPAYIFGVSGAAIAYTVFAVLN